MTNETYEQRNQREHYEIGLKLNSIDNKLDMFLKEMRTAKKVCDKHIEESIPLRDNIRDNTRFRNSATSAIKVIYVAIVGILVKLFFLK